MKKLSLIFILLLLCSCGKFITTNTATSTAVPQSELSGIDLDQIEDLEQLVYLDMDYFTVKTNDSMATVVIQYSIANIGYTAYPTSLYSKYLLREPSAGNVEIFEKNFHVLANYVSKSNNTNGSEYYEHKTGNFEAKCYAITKDSFLIESGVVILKGTNSSDNQVLSHKWDYNYLDSMKDHYSTALKSTYNSSNASTNNESSETNDIVQQNNVVSRLDILLMSVVILLIILFTVYIILTKRQIKKINERLSAGPILQLPRDNDNIPYNPSTYEQFK